jgi:hypothetical protein
MNEEVEKVLVEQLHSAKRRLKNVKRLMRMMPDDPSLPLIRSHIEKNIIWFEGMITSPKKKRKKFEINIKRTWSKIVYSVRFYKFFIRRKK